MNNFPSAFDAPAIGALPEWLDDPSHQVQKIIELLNEIQIPAEPRKLMIVRLAAVVLEQHHAIILLLRMRLNSAALALARVISESCVKLEWVKWCATDVQINNILGGGGFDGLKPLAKEVDKCRNSKIGWTNWLTDNYWIICDYAHTGPVQVSHWQNGDRIESAHPVEELQTSAHHATMMAWIAAGHLAEVSGDAVLEEAVTQGFESFAAQWPDEAEDVDESSGKAL